MIECTRRQHLLLLLRLWIKRLWRLLLVRWPWPHLLLLLRRWRVTPHWLLLWVPTGPPNGSLRVPHSKPWIVRRNHLLLLRWGVHENRTPSLLLLLQLLLLRVLILRRVLWRRRWLLRHHPVPHTDDVSKGVPNGTRRPATTTTSIRELLLHLVLLWLLLLLRRGIPRSGSGGSGVQWCTFVGKDEHRRNRRCSLQTVPIQLEQRR